MSTAKLSAACFAMSYLTNPERVRATVRQLPIEAATAPSYVGVGNKLGAATVRARNYKNVKDYASHMNKILLEARQQSSQLLVLPELSGMLPLSLMPRYEKISAELWQEFQANPDNQKTLFSQFCQTTQGFVSEVFLTTLSELCRLHQISVAGTSHYTVENGRIYNRQYLFSHDGSVEGKQDKLILSEAERTLGVTAGKTLVPTHSPIGSIALLSASALRCYEPFAIARELGCVAATASASPFADDMRCAPFRSQESLLAIIGGGYVPSDDFNLKEGRAAMLFVPRAASRQQNCLLREQKTEGVFTARIDFSRAKTNFDIYCSDRNPMFFEKMLQSEEKTASNHEKLQ